MLAEYSSNLNSYFSSNRIKYIFWSIRSLKKIANFLEKGEIVCTVVERFISFSSLSVIHSNDYFSLKIIVWTNDFRINSTSFVLSSSTILVVFDVVRITIRTSQGSTREIEVGTNRFNHTGETICRIMKCSSWPFLAG